MKNSDKIKNSLIDEFYHETKGKVDKNTEHNDEHMEFKRKLNSVSDKMDAINEHVFDFDINTLSIIEQGTDIREKQKAKKELILFVLLSTIILSFYTISIFIFGFKILLISQIFIVTIIPWIIIPILVTKRKESEA